MITPRKSKIARLPKSIRENLNQRIDDGQSGPEILVWLNADPEVKKVLAEKFDGRPITQQNYSEWRRAGYEDWVKLQHAREMTLQLVEESETFDASVTPQKITAFFATISVAQFVRSAQTRLGECTDTKQLWECICDIQLHLSRLHRDQHRAGHLKLRQDRWDYEVAADKRAADQAAETEERRQMLAWFQVQPDLKDRTQKLGGTDEARDLTALQLELEHNLKIGFLDRQSQEFSFEQDSEGRVPRVPNSGPSDHEMGGRVSAVDHRPRAGDQGPFGVPCSRSSGSGGGTEGASVDSLETRDHSSPANTHPQRLPSPGGEGQDEGELPFRAAAPIPLANDCTPEEFAVRNHPLSTIPISAPRRPSHCRPSRLREASQRSFPDFNTAKTIMKKLAPSTTSPAKNELPANTSQNQLVKNEEP